jgi:hypothetical protein
MSKKNINKIWGGLAVIAGMLTSCQSGDVTFPDYDYQTVYFASQYPVRTVELGEETFVDNTIDNLHKIEIKATTGGVYDNKKDIVIDFKVDESLCNNLYFIKSGVIGGRILPMPSSYYQLASNKITIPQGEIQGGVEVQLTDAFFADPASLQNTYAIPLVMNSAQGADSILRGQPSVSNPDRCIDANWTIVPRDFVLYCVKYVNPWHGNYLRRGIDKITNLSTGVTQDTIRRAINKADGKWHVENDELVSISTNSLTKSTLSLTTKDSGGKNVYYDLLLTFAEDETCTVGGNTSSYDISGTGKFVKKGEKNSIGGSDRNALYLDYKVNFKNLGLQYATKDTLVVRDRGVAPEYYTVVRQ